MAIEWRTDLEAAQKEAAEARKPLLMDFNAAPM